MKYSLEQVQEFKKCRDNAAYFVDNYCKVLNYRDGFIPFKTYDHQKQILETYHDNRFTVVSHARQTGISAITAAYILWYAIFEYEKRILIIAPKDTYAVAFLQIVRDLYESLPDWMRSAAVVTMNNKRDIEFAHGARITARTASCCVGCGMSVSLLVLHDFAFVKNDVAEEMMTALYPTLCTGGRLIITSNFGQAAGYVAEFSEEVIKSGGAYVRVSWNAIPERDEAFKQRTTEMIGELSWKREFETHLR